MKEFKYIWVIGLVATILLVAVPLVAFVDRDAPVRDDAWAQVAPTPAPTDHSDLLAGQFERGTEVTAACLDCHEEAGQEMLRSVHFTWESEPVLLPGRDETVTIGKKNQLNNFCIGIAGNWNKCTTCHAGYDWQDADYDFSQPENVDCLVCHADTGLYGKGEYGNPAEGVDLLAAAQSVGRPTRDNCGSCHFNGGGGDAVKHGDLDSSLTYPPAEVDVHMGSLDFQCVDCHRTENHQIGGHMISVSATDEDAIACTDCHSSTVHDDERLNAHVDTVACETCHIPQGAVRQATKTAWDWSTAGQDLPEDTHTYLKIKGSFVYEENFVPTYAWFNGNADRYIVGDPIDPQETTFINRPLGAIDDPEARITPFKVHEAIQPYDAIYNYLLIPNTAGPGGFWTEFDWQQAFESNQENSGLAYSGEYGFAPTAMYWTMNHMVAPKDQALQCNACHGEGTRLDWQALGYPGDPMEWGGRFRTVVGAAEE